MSRCLKEERLAKRYIAPTGGFARKFAAAEVKLLAQTNALHNTLSPTNALAHARQLDERARMSYVN